MFSKLPAVMLLVAGASAFPNPSSSTTKIKPAEAIGYHFPSCAKVETSQSHCPALIFEPKDGLSKCHACPNGLSIEWQDAAKWYGCWVKVYADLECLDPQPQDFAKDGCIDVPFNSYKVGCKK